MGNIVTRLCGYTLIGKYLDFQSSNTGSSPVTRCRGLKLWIVLKTIFCTNIMILSLINDLISIKKKIMNSVGGGFLVYLILYFVFIFIYFIYIYNYKHNLFIKYKKYLLIILNIKIKGYSIIAFFRHIYKFFYYIKLFHNIFLCFILLNIKIFFFSRFSFLFSILTGVLFAILISLLEFLDQHPFYNGFCLGLTLNLMLGYYFSKVLRNKEGQLEDFYLFFISKEESSFEETFFEKYCFEEDLFAARMADVFVYFLFLLTFLYFLLTCLSFLEGILVFEYANSSYFFEDWLEMRKEALESLAERGITLENIHKIDLDKDPEVLDYIKRFHNKWTFLVYQNKFIGEGLFFYKLLYFLDCIWSGTGR